MDIRGDWAEWGLERRRAGGSGRGGEGEGDERRPCAQMSRDIGTPQENDDKQQTEATVTGRRTEAAQEWPLMTVMEKGDGGGGGALLQPSGSRCTVEMRAKRPEKIQMEMGCG